MANRQVTVLNPAGYQELLQSADTLVVEGDVNMSSNLIGGLPAPVSDNDAARKKYIDDAIAGISVDLQDVTDNGSTTTNSISAAGGTFSGSVSAAGATFTGDVDIAQGEKLTLGSSYEIYEVNGSSELSIKSLAGHMRHQLPASHSVLIEGPTDEIAKFTEGGSCALYHDGVKRLETTNVAVDVTGILTTTGGVNVGNTTQISESDAGSGSYNTLISNGTNGDVVVRGAELFIQDANNANEAWAQFKADGSVELNHITSNTASTKLETKTGGVDVTGDLDVSGTLTCTDMDGDIDCGVYAS